MSSGFHLLPALHLHMLRRFSNQHRIYNNALFVLNFLENDGAWSEGTVYSFLGLSVRRL